MKQKQKKYWTDSDVPTLKLKFFEDTQDRKRLAALENLREVRGYRQYGLVRLVQESYRNGFLEAEEREFLTWVLDQHQIDYSHWSHRTRGLKQLMSQMKGKKRKTNVIQLPLFPDVESKLPITVPIGILPRSYRGRSLAA